MSTKELRLLVLATVVHAAWLPDPGRAQGTFWNLDFESAQVAPVPAGQDGGYVPTTDGLPGWAGFIGTNQLTQVLHNSFNLAVASISIMGPNSDSRYILQGQYSAILVDGRDPFGSGSAYAAASISQAGLVPADARSLRFRLGTSSTALSVSFAGSPLSYFLLGSTPNYNFFGADISPYAGQAGVLEFSAKPIPYPYTRAYLDGIVFSPSSIPEPDAFGLLLLGLAGLALKRPRRRQARLG